MPQDWAGAEVDDSALGRGQCHKDGGGLLPRLLCSQYSRVGRGRDPHHEEVVLLAEEPPQPLVVPTDVQVPDVEALGWWGGRKRHQSLRKDTRARHPLARENPSSLPLTKTQQREDSTLIGAAQDSTPPATISKRKGGTHSHPCFGTGGLTITSMQMMESSRQGQTLGSHTGRAQGLSPLSQAYALDDPVPSANTKSLNTTQGQQESIY